MADYILDGEYWPSLSFPRYYWPVVGTPPIPTATAASETPRSGTEVGVAEPRSASELVAVIADVRSL